MSSGGRTGGHHRGGAALKRGSDGSFHPVHLPGHAGADHLFALYKGLDKVDVGRIAYDGVASRQHFPRTGRKVFQGTGAKTYDVKDWRAIAMVALGVTRLGAIRVPLPEARRAAASHTLLTPTCFWTTSEGDGTSRTAAS